MDSQKKIVAILTPTYNRAQLLVRLYDSLCKQSSHNFVWYVIDDGSTDNTEDVVNSFDTSAFRIVYQLKKNGGKHTALNVGMKIVEEPLTFIVDSDDYLTEDAIETIEADWTRYENDDTICGLSYYRLKENHCIIGRECTEDGTIGSYSEYRINRRDGADKAEVMRSSIMKRYPFPEYPGERFMSEAVVWNAISRAGYKMVYRSKGVYICNYLEGGLTKAGKKLRLQTPCGTMEHARSFFYPAISPRIRAKYILYYTSVAIYSGKQAEALRKCSGAYKMGFMLSYLPGLLLSQYWRVKYK